MSGVIKLAVGQYVKARFWPGEAIWAQITAINDGAIDAVLANTPASAEWRPKEFAHYTSQLKFGDPVSCGIDEVIEIHPSPTQGNRE